MVNDVFVVVLNSFVTGRRSFFAGDRYVGRKANALTFSREDARLIAKDEQTKIGQSVMMDIEGAK